MKLEKETNLKMSENIERMFQEGKYTDVVISLDGGEFRAHKCVLFERSPVFADMLAQKEAKDQEKLVLKGIKPSVMRHLLIFIYTGVIVSTDDISDLFKAAEKVRIPPNKIPTHQ